MTLHDELQKLSTLEEDSRIYEYTSAANPNMPQVSIVRWKNFYS
jgi:hypothetical protein